jgi:predicted PhzF superfamily epimerase YddE/YHI9
MSSYRLVHVFAAADGSHGNALAVFVEGGSIAEARRQAIAADLGYSETVFVDDVESGRLRIFTPRVELPLAGHPLLGTAWVLAHRFGSCEVLRPPAGEVPTWTEKGERWLRARPELAPPMELREYDSVAAVDALDGAPDGLGFVFCWAWMDETAGLLRARVFAPEDGIDEDEATGAAALRICAELGRPLEIHQGRGSVLRARPAATDGYVEIGGRVVDHGEQAYGEA